MFVFLSNIPDYFVNLCNMLLLLSKIVSVSFSVRCVNLANKNTGGGGSNRSLDEKCNTKCERVCVCVFLSDIPDYS